MKREVLHGEGIQGMRFTLSVCDMFVASQAADELKLIIDNHKAIEEYQKTPYDKRSERFPDGEPKRTELSDSVLSNLHSLMLKLSYECKSTLFTEDEE